MLSRESGARAPGRGRASQVRGDSRQSGREAFRQAEELIARSIRCRLAAEADARRLGHFALDSLSVSGRFSAAESLHDPCTDSERRHARGRRGTRSRKCFCGLAQPTSRPLSHSGGRRFDPVQLHQLRADPRSLVHRFGTQRGFWFSDAERGVRESLRMTRSPEERDPPP
jgi:hypothetical protein